MTPTASTHPIADVRALQDAAKAKWSSVVREAILRALRERGEFHADHLAPLGIPDQHRNIIGSQTAKLVNQGWMVECGRRKSTVPSRNGAKSNVYRFTELGRDKLVGVGGGGAISGPVSASPHSGESAPVGAGVPSPQGAEGASICVPNRASTDLDERRQVDNGNEALTASLPAGVDSSEGSPEASRAPAGEPRPEPEPLSLLPEPDPEAWAA